MSSFFAQLWVSLLLLFAAYCAMSFVGASLYARHHPENRTRWWWCSQGMDLLVVGTALWSFRGGFLLPLAFALVAGLALYVAVRRWDTVEERLLPDGSTRKQMVPLIWWAFWLWVLTCLGGIIATVSIVHAAAARV